VRKGHSGTVLIFSDLHQSKIKVEKTRRGREVETIGVLIATVKIQEKLIKSIKKVR
jgi:hypothetical protein